MKKALIVLLVLIALATALYLMGRRPERVAPPEDSAMLFNNIKEGKGVLVQHSENQPLRIERWMPVLPGGHQFVQLLSQTGHQRIALLKNGEMIWETIIKKPQPVREGFFNMAELQDALLMDETAILLFKSSMESSEPPLVIAMDTKTQENRWFFRGKGERLIPNLPGGERAAYLLAKDQIVRLTANPKQGIAANGLRQTRPLDLVPELKNLGDLVFTGSGGFLVAHEGGLSARNAKGEWKHLPIPAGLAPTNPKLAGSAGTYYWQPALGTVLQVKPDTTVVATFGPESWKCAEPNTLDAQLLQLKGLDAKGNLWFILGQPPAPAPFPAPAKPAVETAVIPEPAATPDQPEAENAAALAPPVPVNPVNPVQNPSPNYEALTAHAAKGLDRIYCWEPRKKVLKVLSLPSTWQDLKAPLAMPKQLNGPWPESGTLTIEESKRCWLLPLNALQPK